MYIIEKSIKALSRIFQHSALLRSTEVYLMLKETYEVSLSTRIIQTLPTVTSVCLLLEARLLN